MEIYVFILIGLACYGVGWFVGFFTCSVLKSQAPPRLTIRDIRPGD